MDDPYDILGVPKTATADQIKAAFKKLTRKLHPDLHPGDKAAEEKFKSVSVAYDLLGDAEKRRRFDAGEIDAGGAERPAQRYYRDYADAPGFDPRHPGEHATEDGFASREEFEAFLRQAFGGRSGAAQQEFRARGPDETYSLRVTFLEAANGAVRQIMMPGGQGLRVAIPEGAEDGQTLRLKGQGGAGYGGGPAGDAYVTLQVEPHAFFHRRDDNIHMELPVTLKEAVLGATIEAPTIAGPVALTIPRGSNTGRVLRLRERGVRNRRTGQRGHQLVTIKVVLPPEPDPALTAFLEGWTPATPYDPRKEIAP